MSKKLGLSSFIAALSALALIGAAQVASAQNKLEPAGPPGPTMKTLDEIPPAWSQRLPANDTGDSCNSSRFECVMPTALIPTGAAVLDRETGLVWERLPPPTVHNLNPLCFNRTTGNRKGWRFPSYFELASLLDLSAPQVAFEPRLPPGHPFLGVLADEYWSASALLFDRIVALNAPTRIVTVNFGTGGVGDVDPLATDPKGVWCVRGPAGPDGL